MNEIKEVLEEIKFKDIMDSFEWQDEELQEAINKGIEKAIISKLVGRVVLGDVHIDLIEMAVSERAFNLKKELYDSI